MNVAMRAFNPLEYRFATQPESFAVIDDKAEYNYGQLASDIRRIINRFSALGLSDQDRVAVISKNRYEMLALILAGLYGGPVIVPVNRRINPEEMLWIVRDSEASSLVADGEILDAIHQLIDEDIPEALRICLDENTHGWVVFDEWKNSGNDEEISIPIDTDRAYLQIYTSGTSGRPKGVVLTEFNCLGQIFALLAAIDASIQPNDSIYEALPLFHVGGVFVSLFSLSLGATLVYSQEFNPVTVEGWLSDGEVHHAAMVPAMIQACMGQPYHSDGYPGLKTLLYGASPIARGTLISAVERYGCDFVQIYGMTETHSVISILTADDHKQIVNDQSSDLIRSAGRAVPGTDLKICEPHSNKSISTGEVGEIRVRSPHVMSGYWKNDQANVESFRDGYFATGDAAYLDDKGYLYIVDRIKDIIVTGGENVSSLEVESVLLRYPQVLDVAVIGTPDADWGEAVTALLVINEPSINLEDVVDHCKSHLGGFKVPKRIELVDQIPRNAAGKILKAQLRKKYWSEVGRNVA